MSIDGLSLDVLYYRLALSNAKYGDLSGAVTYARMALALNGENEKARRLLDICLYELGWSDTDSITSLAISGALTEINKRGITLLSRIRPKRILAHYRTMSGLSRMRQSVRVLNIRGCLYAINGRYKKAESFFALALATDNGNQLAAEALKDIAKRRANARRNSHE